MYWQINNVNAHDKKYLTDCTVQVHEKDVMVHVHVDMITLTLCNLFTVSVTILNSSAK